MSTAYDIGETATPGDPIGLALGGGGARGLAHILVLEVFDELGLTPAVIAGTSIGALIGGAYASGLDAKEIGTRARDILSHPAEIARRLFSGKPRDWMDLWTIRPFSASLMNPRALTQLVFPEAASTDFTRLKIPFRAVATDYRSQSPVALREGPLDLAIAASMALPALFRPVEHEEQILVDGGLTDPLPFDRLGRGCTLSVAVDVTGHTRVSAERAPTALEAVLSISQIMQNAIIREKLKSESPDILIRPPVDTFRILEFYKIGDILEAAAPIKDDLKRALDKTLTDAGERIP
jgi:NTE family protein